MKEKGKIENTLGMFDLLKGVTMLLIVFTHATSLFPELFGKSTAELPIILKILFAIIYTFRIVMMPAFLVIGGYGFRKRPVGKCFRLLAKDMVKPYVFTVIMTTICNFCLHYAFFRYIPGALSESLKVFLGMVLGVSDTVTIGGYTLYANGPVWFILALFWSLVLFNVILNVAKEKTVPYVVFAVSVIGWLISYLPLVPWCISQGMVGVVYAYMGYWIKKNKYINREFSFKGILAVVVLIIVPNIIMCSLGFITDMACNEYSLGPITYIENGLMGIVVAYIFLKLNVIRGKISGSVRTVGLYSLYVMCVHSIEMISVPWYKVSELFASYQLLGFCVIYLVKLVIIFVGVFLIVKIKELKNKT